MVTNNTFFRHTCPIDLYTLNYINQFYHNTAFIISIELIYTKILLQILERKTYHNFQKQI